MNVYCSSWLWVRASRFVVLVRASRSVALGSEPWLGATRLGTTYTRWICVHGDYR